MTDFSRLSIKQLLSAYRSRQTSPLEVVTQLLQRIDQYEHRMGAFLHLNREGALQAARKAEQDLELPLAGVPFAIKDNLSTEGIGTTCGSKILHNYIPPFDATVIARLKAAGAIVIGKTNCDEFAMGSSTENSAFQITRNPWNGDYSPGGSSGGSAAAVASRFAFAALGSDTGGSVRQPASFCGTVGIKPTYGRVSRYGLVAFGSSLDCVGVITRSVEDAALSLSVLAGHDAMDSTSSTNAVPDYVRNLELQATYRVGVPREYFAAGLSDEVRVCVNRMLAELESDRKVQLKEISLPHTEFAIAVYYVVATAEASANLARFDGVRYGHRTAGQLPLKEMYRRTRAEGFGAEVKRRIMLGTFALRSGYYDAYYLQAAKVRSLIAQDFRKAFDEVDLICTPTSPTPPFRLGEKINDPLAMYLSDVYTVTANLTGLPAISVPCGFDSNRLPIGLQIIGNHFQEPRIFQLASLIEKQHSVQVPEIT